MRRKKEPTKLIRRTIFLLIIAILSFELGYYMARNNDCYIHTTYE